MIKSPDSVNNSVFVFRKHLRLFGFEIEKNCADPLGTNSETKHFGPTRIYHSVQCIMMKDCNIVQILHHIVVTIYRYITRGIGPMGGTGIQFNVKKPTIRTVTDNSILVVQYY